MARLRLGETYWLSAYGHHAQHFPTLQSDCDADIVIVGGGVTGGDVGGGKP